MARLARIDPRLAARALTAREGLEVFVRIRPTSTEHLTETFAKVEGALVELGGKDIRRFAIADAVLVLLPTERLREVAMLPHVAALELAEGRSRAL